MTAALNASLLAHLIRDDDQEDLCLALYSPSSGAERDTALLRNLRLPEVGEREVHGNVTFTGRYVLRVAQEAQLLGLGVAVLHSHPDGQGWQRLSRLDEDAEGSYAGLVGQLTGLPLVGLTLAVVDRTWSARRWSHSGDVDHAENVRVVGSALKVSWNPTLIPVPATTPSQIRTVSAWGSGIQADLARLRVLVVGLGSVGMDVAIRLAATGLTHVGGMDFDVVHEINRDRLVFATTSDASQEVAKVEVTRRAATSAATAELFVFAGYEYAVTEPRGLEAALDYDLIFCCVDRPWPRGVLNQVAYTDLIPVIDGGIAIDPFPNGGMRNATIRTHVLHPGGPCMQCNGQLDPADLSMDRLGLLDDPQYIAQLGISAPSKENVAALSIGVVASQLALFVSYLVEPGGLGDPGPLRFWLSNHRLEHLQFEPSAVCFCQTKVGDGDRRVDLTREEGSRPQGDEGERP